MKPCASEPKASTVPGSRAARGSGRGGGRGGGGENQGGPETPSLNQKSIKRLVKAIVGSVFQGVLLTGHDDSQLLLSRLRA